MMNLNKRIVFMLLLVSCVHASLLVQAQQNNWEILFNGKNLDGWQQLNGKHIWEVSNGMIVGTTVPGEPNGFLCTTKHYGDFILELEVSIDTLMNNSGVQFRSLSYPGYQNGRVHGYQMEVDPKPQQWSGAIYEEGGNRGWLFPGERLSVAAKKAFKRDTKKGYQWNKYRIECAGTDIRTFVNGVPAAHLVDDKFLKGFIGLQLHANQQNDPAGSFKVRFRNIRIQTGKLKLSPPDDAGVVNLLTNSRLSNEKESGKYANHSKGDSAELFVKHNTDSGTISIYRSKENGAPILVQNAKRNERPYIHPIVAPDGKGILTQFRPPHHLHQTGLYWGLKMVNGRDYFMNWQQDYWRKVSDSVITSTGQSVEWKTVYDLLDEKGMVCLTETQHWTMQIKDGAYWIDLVWKGDAKKDITVGKFYVGGLFLRMPWFKGIAGEVINSNGQRNQEAEGQKALWTDVGMAITSRADWGHFAIFDHPGNKTFPVAWRVDNELGVGPSRQITGDWKLNKGSSEIVRYRIVVYTGDFNHDKLMKLWKEFCCAY
jgi:hypothetical protein